MSWLVRLLGIDKALGFADDFEAAAAKVRGRRPAAVEGPKKKARAAGAAAVAP